MRFYQIITFILLLILPFFPKQLDIWIVYLIGLYALSLLPIYIKNLPLLKRDFKTVFFILFLIAASISTIFSFDWTRSILTLTLFLYYFIIFTSIKFVLPKFKDREKLAGVLVLATFFLSLISIYYTIFQGYSNREPEGISFFWVYYGHNHLSSLLLFSLPLGLYFLETYRQKKIFCLSLLFLEGILFLALLFTFARASLSSLLLALFFLTFLFTLVAKKKIFMLVLVSLLIFNIVILGSRNSAKSVGVGKYELTPASRTIYWKEAVDNFLKNPLTGSGLDTFRLVDAQRKTKTPTRTYYTHNFFLQILSDAGILGFLTSIGLIFSVLWYGYKRVEERIGAKEGLLYLMFWVGIFASTLNTFVDFDWQLPTVFLIFWVIAGLF